MLIVAEAVRLDQIAMSGPIHIPDPREREVAVRYFKPFVEYFRGCRHVLDVASGQGHFLEMLKEAGIGAQGVEIDSALCELARDKGLDVVQGNFFEFLRSAQSGSFDGAAASHIVEHHSPVQVEELLLLLHQALKPGSLLVVITPNIANIRRAVGDFWRDPTHVRPYPVAALTKLMRRTGWEVVKSDEYTDRPPSLLRSIVYGVRNALLGRYWSGDDLYVIARRSA
ncbi:MAG: class I SAM-dependent methyltransferase [Xanthobacteraceae bacterium]